MVMKPTRHIFRCLPVNGSLVASSRLILLSMLSLISISSQFAIRVALAQQPASKIAPGLRAAVPKHAPTAADAIDPVTGIAHSQRLASGVPLGGIGTGTFQLLTDGTVAQASVANNWDHPLQNAPGCFAAIWTRTENRSTARVLALTSPYNMPTVTKLDYDGLFPQAILTYPDPDLPVMTSLLAFSPLVPFDLKNSSFPAAAYVLHLKNSDVSPVEISVALSWESLLPDHSARNEGTRGTAAIIPSSEGFFGARFTSGEKVSDQKVSDQKKFSGKAAGDSKAKETASKSLTPKNSKDTYTGGTMALLAYPQRAQALVTTALWDAGELKQPAWWEMFAHDGSVSREQLVNSNAPPTADKPALTQAMNLARPAGVVAVRLTLKPGESVDLPFSVSWFLPNLTTPGGEDVGHYYEIAFANAEDAGHQLLEDWSSLYGLTEEWQKRLTFSNLPRWSARRIINAAAPLAANTVHTRDGRFAFLGAVGGEINSQNSPIPLSASSALEAEREETRAHQAAEALLLTLYPQLAAQELTQFGAAQDIKGFIVPPATGDWGVRLGLATTNRKPPVVTAPSPSPALVPLDATAGYVLAMARLTFWAGDPDFLHKNYPNLRQAVLALLSLEKTFTEQASSENALAEKAFAEKTAELGKPLTPSTLSLWLAALRAGGRMAILAEDASLASSCMAAGQRGSTLLETRYWNGEFYADAPLSVGAQGGMPAPTDICATDQLWGQWLAYQLDLGPLALPEHLSRALQSLQQRNDRSLSTPGTRPGLSGWPSARVRADGQPLSDSSGSDCLLPASVLADAFLNLWQEQPETGMALLLRLETVRNSAARSPWQYPSRIKRGKEPGSEQSGREVRKEEARIERASLAAASDWNLLSALEGFALDIYSENGVLTLTPNIPGTWRTFTAPIFAPTFWGRMEFRPAVHGGVTIFRLDRLIGFIAASGSALLKNKAVLTLKTLRVLGPPRRQDGSRPVQITARVAQGQKPIGCTATLDAKGVVTLTFDSLLKMTAGDRLEVEIH